MISLVLMLVGVAGFVLGVVVCARAVRDRIHRTRSGGVWCRHCGYPDIEHGLCPECGVDQARSPWRRRSLGIFGMCLWFTVFCGLTLNQYWLGQLESFAPTVAFTNADDRESPAAIALLNGLELETQGVVDRTLLRRRSRAAMLGEGQHNPLLAAIVFSQLDSSEESATDVNAAQTVGKALLELAECRSLVVTVISTSGPGVLSREAIVVLRTDADVVWSFRWGENAAQFKREDNRWKMRKWTITPTTEEHVIPAERRSLPSYMLPEHSDLSDGDRLLQGFWVGPAIFVNPRGLTAELVNELDLAKMSAFLTQGIRPILGVLGIDSNQPFDSEPFAGITQVVRRGVADNRGEQLAVWDLHARDGIAATAWTDASNAIQRIEWTTEDGLICEARVHRTRALTADAPVELLEEILVETGFMQRPPE